MTCMVEFRNKQKAGINFHCVGECGCHSNSGCFIFIFFFSSLHFWNSLTHLSVIRSSIRQSISIALSSCSWHRLSQASESLNLFSRTSHLKTIPTVAAIPKCESESAIVGCFALSFSIFKWAQRDNGREYILTGVQGSGERRRASTRNLISLKKFNTKSQMILSVMKSWPFKINDKKAHKNY